MVWRTRSDNTLTTSGSGTLEYRTDTLSSKYYLPATNQVYETQLIADRKSHGVSKTMTDFVTPSYTSIIARGGIINSPMSLSEIIEEDPLVNCDYSSKEYYSMYDTVANVEVDGLYKTHSVFGAYPFSAISGAGYLPAQTPIDTARIKSLAISEAYASINDSDLLVGAVIAESGKTTRDLLTLARKVIKVVRAIKHPSRLKRFNKKSIKAAARESEELYMQARYNLRPLYYDILGAMKLTQKVYHPPRLTYRGSAKDSKENTDTIDFVSWLFPYVKFRLTRKSTFSAEARAGVLCSVSENTAWKRIGIALIPETVWELTPFSFILDWFGNFGSVISSWAPSPGVQKLTSWVTVETNSTQTNTVEILDITQISNPSASLGRLKAVDTSLFLGTASRTKNLRTKVRSINPSRSLTPVFNLNLDTLKSLDLAIIGKNLLTSIRARR